MIKSWIRNATKKKRNTGQTETASRYSHLPATAKLCSELLIVIVIQLPRLSIRKWFCYPRAARCHATCRVGQRRCAAERWKSRPVHRTACPAPGSKRSHRKSRARRGTESLSRLHSEARKGQSSHKL